MEHEYPESISEIKRSLHVEMKEVGAEFTWVCLRFAQHTYLPRAYPGDQASWFGYAYD